MANSITFLVFLALIVVGNIQADPNPTVGSDESDSSSDRLAALTSKIQSLESQLQARSEELKAKDDVIAEKEKMEVEKTDAISSLKAQLSSLKKKGKLDADEKLLKAQTRVIELEKEADLLRNGLELQRGSHMSLESRAVNAEKKSADLAEKLKQLQSVNEEQKTKLYETERSLKVSEEEIRKVKLEASLVMNDLKEVHGAWLPPWLAQQYIYYHSLLQAHWKQHGKPSMDLFMQKAIEKKAEAEKWAEPHFETINKKWVPAAKEHWVNIRQQVEPHIQMVSTKTIEAYDASKDYVHPYYQKVEKSLKPYVEQVAAVTEPHVEKARVVLDPYTKQATHYYKRFLESASAYHSQMQTSVRETLEKHELTKPFAANEFVWFAASALLFLPIIILSRTCSTIFMQKTKKSSKNGRGNHGNHGNHSRRKAKKGHTDK